MPVKNKNRQSNSGYEGVITGLNDEEKKVLEDAGIGGGGIPTTNINTQTFQLDTSSLTAKDSYVIASMDDGEGFISYVPLQTYFFNDGYFNKEVKMQTTSHDFRLSLASVSFQSYNNYTANTEATNVDFTNTLDSTNTWTKLGDIKYIAIEEKNALTGESSHKYLEISGGGGPLFDMFPYYQPSTQTVTQEGFDLLTQKLFNNEIVGISLGEVGPCMLLNDMKGTSISFISPYQGNSGRLKATFNADLSAKTEYVDKGGPSISLTLPQTAPSSQVIPSITTSNTQQNLTIGSGLEIKNGALQEKVLTISITDILTDNSKIQELFSKMTSTTEQSALILFDNPISYDKYKDYDTIKLDLSPLSSMSISGYYILKNQSHVNGFTPVYSLNTIGMEYSGSNLNKLVVKNLFITGNDEVNTPLNKFLLKIL